MAQVIALDQFRDRSHFQRMDAAPRERPVFRADDVWGRNYCEIESVVYGLLKVREALKYYTPYDAGLDDLLLEALDAAFKVKQAPKDMDRVVDLRESVLPIKDHILAHLRQDSAKHLKTALILLDLIEKSPLYR